MKLIIAIVQERDKQRVSDTLLSAGHKFTVVSSTGGFLRDGNTTLLIGAQKELVDDVIEAIRGCCSAREDFVSQPTPDVLGTGGVLMSPVKVSIGGAIIFVVDVERFESV